MQLDNAGINITRLLIGQSMAINVNPSLILRPSYFSRYLILNPQRDALTDTVPAFIGSAQVAGNTQTTPIDVAGIESVHIHLNISAITGSWSFWNQSYDSISGRWADGQKIFESVQTENIYYASLGNIGIAEQLAFRWVPTKIGSITFSIGVVRKRGIGGNVAAIKQIVYLGGPGVSHVSGFPILEGQNQQFSIDQGVELWAVSTIPLDLRIFQLS